MSARPLRALAFRLRLLRGDERGLALIEFAFTLPILLWLSMYGLETANIAIANLRVSQMATLTADNAARVRDTIDEADVNELLLGSKMTGDAISFATRGRIILSSLEMNPAKNGQWIRWQRCAGLKNVQSLYGAQGDGQTGTALATGMGPTGRKVAALDGTAVMFVEVVYDYKQIVPIIGLGENRVIRFTSAFNVRKRNDQVLKNASNLTNAQKSLCTKFEA